jgi:flagellar biosynthetic protein FlhB
MPKTLGDKTHDASPHRRQQAREKGQVAFSQDLGSAILLVISAGLLMGLGGRVVDFCASLMAQHLAEVPRLASDPSVLLVHWAAIIRGLSKVVLPILGLVILAGVATNVFQTGFLWVPSRLVPDIHRVNPVHGLQRIFSISGAVRLGFGIFKLVIIGAVTASVLWSQSGEILSASGYSLSEFSQFLADIVIRLILWVGLALAVVALLDFAFQRWKHEQDLRMTYQEVREEMKNLQGDPQVTARRRSIQRQMVLQRIATAVPKADVVVTNPTELAVAIQYKPGEMTTPIVVAKGTTLSQQIRCLALENNVPVVEHKSLAQLLYKEVDIQHPIPDKSYAAVAELLAYVYQLQGKTPSIPPASAT